jgi:hypothetical protein
MSTDGLMPSDLVKMAAMIRDFSAYGFFAQHRAVVRNSAFDSAIEWR